MSKLKATKKSFSCKECGFRSLKWLGKCPECGSWDSFIEINAEKGGADGPLINGYEEIKPISLSEISEKEQQKRYLTTIGEFDRVLGGGIVPGSLILLGGEPGIGKSTILLQALSKLCAIGLKILYVSGEESGSQIKLRANRLGINEDIFILSNPSLEATLESIEKISPDILAIDSIQTIFSSNISSLPGSIGQIRGITSTLMHLAKKRHMPTFIIGHVTKEGAIAGPKTLEHMVDTVLYFEGDRTQSFRILRTVKNRFGPCHEIGIFEMCDSGLNEVKNPSHLFLGEDKKHSTGSVIFPAIEGTRPILIEIQALVNNSFLALPRRTTSGIDTNRLALLVAVSEKILGLTLYDKDIFLNVVGGFKLTETACDLPIICAIISSLKEVPLPTNIAFFGEVGLTGEIRPVTNMPLRLNEVQRLGFNMCVMPYSSEKSITTIKDLKIITIRHLKELHDILTFSNNL